jgi:hypothetical protein
MNVPDNKHKAPKDTLLNKILDEISSQKSDDSIDKEALEAMVDTPQEHSIKDKDIIIEDEPMPSQAEIETANIQAPIEDDKECEASSIELTDADVSTKKYCKKSIINEEAEEEKAPRKISWLKMFFLFLSIVFILNIVYIMYFMNTKESYMADKEKTLIAIEQEVLEEEIIKKEIVEKELIKKEIPKPIIKTPTIIKKETMSIAIVPVAEPQEVRSSEKVVIQEEVEVNKTAEEIHQEQVNKNPQNFIDVIEMTTVTPEKVIPQERTKPLTEQEKKLIERHKAKALLLEQMNQ